MQPPLQCRLLHLLVQRCVQCDHLHRLSLKTAARLLERSSSEQQIFAKSVYLAQRPLRDVCGTSASLETRLRLHYRHGLSSGSSYHCQVHQVHEYLSALPRKCPMLPYATDLHSRDPVQARKRPLPQALLLQRPSQRCAPCGYHLEVPMIVWEAEEVHSLHSSLASLSMKARCLASRRLD